MSKGLTKSTHWLPKTGSYSVRMNSRGDIGSELPDSARALIFDDLLDRASRSQDEIKKIDSLLAVTDRDDERARLLKRKFSLEAELKNLRFDKLTIYFNRYADHFLAASRRLLSEADYRRIEQSVVMEIGNPPRHWQRFLGDNGFGKTDTTTYE